MRKVVGREKLEVDVRYVVVDCSNCGQESPKPTELIAKVSTPNPDPRLQMLRYDLETRPQVPGWFIVFPFGDLYGHGRYVCSKCAANERLYVAELFPPDQKAGT